MSFLLAWLGSALFWAMYVVLTLVGSIISLRVIAPNTMDVIRGVRSSSRYPFVFGKASVATLIMVHVLFWQIVLISLIIWKIIELIFGKIFCGIYKYIDNIIPNIKIEREE